MNQQQRQGWITEREQAELSINLAENSIRPVAVGRDYCLLVGSEKAGPKVAAILSVIESGRTLGAGPRDYLAGVLPGLERKALQQVRVRPHHAAEVYAGSPGLAVRLRLIAQSQCLGVTSLALSDCRFTQRPILFATIEGGNAAESTSS